MITFFVNCIHYTAEFKNILDKQQPAAVDAAYDQIAQEGYRATLIMQNFAINFAT